MELKSQFYLTHEQINTCSNRTFMELKFDKLADTLRQMQVLIAPLWN